MREKILKKMRINLEKIKMKKTCSCGEDSE